MEIRRYLNYFKWYWKRQDRDAIKTTLAAKGVIAGSDKTLSEWANLGRLRRYELTDFQDILVILERSKRLSLNQIDSILVKRPEATPLGVYKDVPDQVILDCLRGQILDLRDLPQKMLEFRARGDASRLLPAAVDDESVESFTPPEGVLTPQMVDATSDLRNALESLFDKAETQGENVTTQQVWALVDQGKARIEAEIGLFNICVNTPNPDDVHLPVGQQRWIRGVDSRYWQSGPTAYSPETGGHIPDKDTTLGSIFKAKGRVFVVDIADLRKALEQKGYSLDLLPKKVEDWPIGLGDYLRDNLSSFNAAGIKPSLQSIADDLRGTRPDCDTRMVFIKLKTAQNIEAVVQCHALTGKDKTNPLPALLPIDQLEAQRRITLLESYFRVPLSYIARIKEDRAKALVVEGSSGRAVAPQVLIPSASQILTENLLFNPQSGIAYPRNPGEYHTIMSRLLDAQGRFPGDESPLSASGTFSDKRRGVHHAHLKRRGQNFFAEMFTPTLHAQGRFKRLIFDVDLLSQSASYDAYGTRGVSYDIESYYVRRMLEAQKVPFNWFEGWPVSFAALQGFEMSYQNQNLYYAFIHFVMTVGKFQRYGLTSYSIRQAMSSLFYSDVWHNKPNLIIGEDGEIEDKRWQMWAAMHTGRFAAFYSFVKAFGAVDPSWDPIAQAIFKDVHQRITPQQEIATRGWPVSRGVVAINGGSFALAMDPGVYLANARYPHAKGSVSLPQSELSLPSGIREAWLEAIGGDQGVIEGNSLYGAGIVSLGGIKAAKKKERTQEGGLLERLGSNLVARGVDRGK